MVKCGRAWHRRRNAWEEESKYCKSVKREKKKNKAKEECRRGFSGMQGMGCVVVSCRNGREKIVEFQLGQFNVTLYRDNSIISMKFRECKRRGCKRKRYSRVMGEYCRVEVPSLCTSSTLLFSLEGPGISRSPISCPLFFTLTVHHALVFPPTSTLLVVSGEPDRGT